MKKGVFIVCCSIALAMTACGNSQTEEKTSATTESSTVESQENTQEKAENSVNVEIGKVRTALSDTGVQPQDLIGLPEGVAPEFTYYIYDIGFDGMVKAQQYLEQIGVSEEGKKLIALWKQDNTATPIIIEEYTFDDDTIYYVQHTFDSCENNYKKAMDDYGEDVIDYTDADAYYTRTVPIEEPVSYLRSYDTLVESLNDQYRTVIW